jgi:DNA-binding NtrC family response regulator
MALILIVEDEAQVLVLAESYLQEHGHQTLSASSAAEALAILDGEQSIDVLFTDIGLRDNLQAGLELAKEAVKRRPDLKVLYTTGQTVTDGMRALFVEDSALLEKPYTVDQLLTTLSAHFKIGPNTRTSG